jgi:hypothetical protein
MASSRGAFADMGDAKPRNGRSKVAKHLLRLASTRAIARSLRTFTNIGYTCLEELADLNDVIGSGSKSGSKPKTQKSASKKPKAAKSTQSKSKSSRSGSNAKSASQDDQIESKDTGNSSGNKPDNDRSKTQATGKQPAMSEAQKRAIYNLSRRRGISVEDLEQMSVDAYGLSVENLSSKDASAFIRNLQQAA